MPFREALYDILSCNSQMRKIALEQNKEKKDESAEKVEPEAVLDHFNLKHRDEVEYFRKLASQGDLTVSRAAADLISAAVGIRIAEDAQLEGVYRRV